MTTCETLYRMKPEPLDYNVSEIHECKFSDLDIQFLAYIREIFLKKSVSFIDFTAPGDICAFGCSPKPISNFFDSFFGVVIMGKYVLTSYIGDKLLIPILFFIQDHTHFRAILHTTKFTASKKNSKLKGHVKSRKGIYRIKFGS